MIEQIKLPATDISQIKAQTITVPVGNASYTVAVAAMSGKCIFKTSVVNSSLNPANVNDKPCFVSPDTDSAILSDNTLVLQPSACETQQWEIQAGVTDNATGTKVSQVQGITVRVPATTPCL